MDAEEDFIKATARGFSRAVILWLVSKRPMSGYRIVEEMKKLTGQKFSPGIIYPLLYDLEKSGFIAGEWIEKGRRRIKYYSINENGTKLLNRLRVIFEMPVKEAMRDLIKNSEL
jgi:DNA-binding PadR family transcriptional regulator